MADSRHFEKSKNRHISAMVGPIGAKFGHKTIAHIGVKNFEFLKSTMVESRHLKEINRHNSAAV